MASFEKTPRNTVKRIPKRGHYDKETIYGILDAAFLCHIGFSVNGQPFVIPTIFGRDGDVLYIHGASTSRMLKEAEGGDPICLTVTHFDGLVLARSAFHHSMNYRSAVIFGKAKKIEGPEKDKALYCISEQILKGRWDEAREPNAKELKATTVLRIDIENASAKIRTGPPGDDAADYDLPIWAGVLPSQQVYGAAITDPDMRMEMPLPESVRQAAIKIEKYQPAYKAVFKSLNAAWVQRYFTLEEHDLEQLEHPEKYILPEDGEILFATSYGNVVGCVAMVNVAEGEFELAKMAVDDGFKGMGIGQQLGKAALDYARSKDAKKVWLETNDKLPPAIKLYEKLGFKHVDLIPSPYARANVRMELEFS